MPDSKLFCWSFSVTNSSTNGHVSSEGGDKEGAQGVGMRPTRLFRRFLFDVTSELDLFLQLCGSGEARESAPVLVGNSKQRGTQ